MYRARFHSIQYVIVVLLINIYSACALLYLYPALQPHEIYEFFSRVRSHANDLKDAYSKCVRGNLRVPLITVS